MNKFCSRLSCLALAAVLAQPALAQVTIIDDNLNIDTSANYTVVNGGVTSDADPMTTVVPDGETLFAYDYSAIGIPSAPGTTDGSTTGVRISVNDTTNNGGVDETEATTIFHNTIVDAQDYTMTVDVWMGVWLPADNGSTESAQIGVAGDGVTRNHLFELTGAGCCNFSGSGHFVSLSGDGADQSDYRHWEAGGPVNQFDTDYLSPDNDTNVGSLNFFGFFEEISNLDAPIPGVIGNNWATVKVELLQSEGKIKYYVRGGSAATTGDPSLPPEFLQIIESDIVDAEGLVSFGLADMYSSVATVPEDQFAIFDNLLVTGMGMTGPDGDFNNDDAWDCDDINALTAAIAAGSTDLSFDMNGDEVITIEDVTDATVGWLAVGGAANPVDTDGNPFLEGDANLDGEVDGNDFLTWNGNKFQALDAWCLGDFNGDGEVDGPDFLIWNTFKFQSSDAVNAVPEPASGLLLLTSLLVTGFVRRR